VEASGVLKHLPRVKMGPAGKPVLLYSARTTLGPAQRRSIIRITVHKAPIHTPSASFQRCPMQRHVLLALTFLALFACNDASAPDQPLSAPAFAKAGAGGITITSIGPAREASQAEDVNDAGLVVGYTENLATSPQRAFLWTPTQPRGATGTYLDLGTFGGPTSAAKGINNAGSIVGFATDGAGAGHPFIWTRAGGMQDLGLDPLWTSGAPQDINEAGDVTGVAGTAGGNRAVVWHVSIDAAGVVQVRGRETLEVPTGWETGVAFAVNNVGQVTGWISSAAVPNHAALWTPSAAGWIIEDLGLLPGDYSSGAYALNDRGQVVGWSRPQQGCVHATLWTTQNGHLTTTRALETGIDCNAEAWAINNDGQITGRAHFKSGSNAALWSLSPDGTASTIIDLGKPSGSASSLGIGMSGTIGGVTQVAGLSNATSGGSRALFWTVR
jgi:probable HAF family extracellular repeat protein